MDSNMGTLIVGGTEVQLVSADCTLFIGRLDVDFDCGNTDGALRNLPFGDAVEFTSLRKRTIEMSDFLSAEYENPIFKPSFRLDRNYYSVTSLSVDAVDFCSKTERLTLSARFAAMGENESKIAASIAVSADCVPIDCTYMMMCQETIPIRFANRYLPLIGLPVLPDDATRSDIVTEYGTPNDQGGGPHTGFGTIPIWIRYTLPSCFLRFQLESDKITHVTVMPKDGPFAPRAG
ncbi:hypothetical protein RESH_03048 [Rhodopirellula europaea SH398]|uniref:Uncharacterized protein n=2 Tax=Rhodopirellula TaxID=265488 RepID=M5S4G7_9BACT|nr:hypothetical protein RESH_03048 [Rhodopirellula europaea SH398]